MVGYIYKTTNLINGKIYIGQHKSDKFDNKYYGSGYILRQAIHKYHIENFICEIIEWCEDYESLDEREIYWISKYNSTDSNIGYNLSYGGKTARFSGENHPMYGRKHTDESKYRNRISHLGKKHSNETKEKISKGNKCKKLSDEHKKKISMANKGRRLGDRLTDEGRKKISESNKGKILSEDTRAKISDAHKGKKFSDEHRKKLSDSHKGNKGYWKSKHRYETTKQKISDALSNKPREYRRIHYRIGDKEFSGLNEGAIYFGITKSCMSLWVKRGYTKDNKPIHIII